MAEYPLLVFPQLVSAERARRHGGFGGIRRPDARRQVQRLTPQFERLQDALQQKRLSLQDNPLGTEPEKVLVIETIGSIENFVNAVGNIEGLEWLGEFDLNDIKPEFGFEEESDPQKRLKGRLFLVMTDQSAQDQIVSLFKLWAKDQDARFPHGLAPLKHAFEYLHTIRYWNAEDRICDTGVLEDWRLRLQLGQEVVPFEVELWCRGSLKQRQQAESQLRSIIASLGGEVVNQCVITDIAYHGISGRIPIGHVQEIVQKPEVRQNVKLLQCEDVMYLRPVGQCAIHVPEDTTETNTPAAERQPELPQGDPIIALLDGLPLTGHCLLDGRLIIDDPDGYESAYQAHERVHGTGMASLICHGDLNESTRPARRHVYVRPIMQPRRGFDGRFVELIPEGILSVDLVHQAVKRICEGESSEPPTAPSVRVINLSVCDHSRPLDREISPWARLLDWLAWKYNVLFIVSAGNYLDDIELDIPRSELSNLTAEEREKAVIKSVAADTRNRRLLAPAETLNGLTLAATHVDSSPQSPNPRHIDPFTQIELPSVTSAHGPGYRRSIKPDILMPGGRQLLSEKLGTTHTNTTLALPRFNLSPGQRVATPGRQGLLNETNHARGTSNAAALASRGASLLYEVLEQLRAEQEGIPPPEYDAVLMKTLLVHGADWGNAWEVYEQALENRRDLKEYIGRFLGYGAANIAKVMACTDQRVTVLGFGELDNDDAHEFRLPLPPSLSAVAEKRRLTITLAWLTPVNSRNQKYRIAHLWFDPKTENLFTPNRMDADHRAVQRGTVQHEVLEGSKAVAFQDGDNIIIKVNCRADAGDITEPIRYGLAATLEIAEGINIPLVSLPIYQEVRDRLPVRVPVAVQGASSG